MNIDRFLSLDDFDEEARRFLPRPIYGYIESGVETRTSLRANREAFEAVAFVTRVLRDVSERSIETELLGKRYAAPFGIAPLGISALSAYRGDLALAASARTANIPMVMSGASLIRLEEVAVANPDAWFQAYLSGDAESIGLMLSRVRDAGFETLVLTVDTQGRPNKENHIRCGFSSPFRPSLRLLWDGMTHPRWLTKVLFPTLLRYGMPHFENSSHVRGPPMLAKSAEREFSGRSRLTWEHIRLVRREWRGRLIIKGILSLPDALMAQEHGADAVVLSNHGGRQLDGAIAAFDLLPEIVAGVPDFPVMVDGGFRRGTDVVKALALGAAFVFIGRPLGYAAAIAGTDGIDRAISLLSQEVSRNIAFLGFTSIAQLDASCLRRVDGRSVSRGT